MFLEDYPLNDKKGDGGGVRRGREMMYKGGTDVYIRKNKPLLR